jgi:Protein of unknown function (DUF3017)
MANRPANAGSDSAGPDRVYDREPAVAGAPPPVHHQGLPRSLRTAPGPRPASAAEPAAGQGAAIVHALAWLPYLAVLACAATGLFITWQGSRYAAQGTGLVGVALLLAAAARLLLPTRYAGPLASRHKAPDVAGFAVFGTAVLVLALTLP